MYLAAPIRHVKAPGKGCAVSLNNEEDQMLWEDLLAEEEEEKEVRTLLLGSVCVNTCFCFAPLFFHEVDVICIFL